jgi:hypothetical protein
MSTTVFIKTESYELNDSVGRGSFMHHIWAYRLPVSRNADQDWFVESQSQHRVHITVSIYHTSSPPSADVRYDRVWLRKVVTVKKKFHQLNKLNKIKFF